VACGLSLERVALASIVEGQWTVVAFGRLVCLDEVDGLASPRPAPDAPLRLQATNRTFLFLPFLASLEACGVDCALSYHFSTFPAG